MRISDYYRDQNEQLHKRGRFGGSGHKHALAVRTMASHVQAESILDYGCGQGTLAPSVHPWPVRNYDPAVPHFAAEPEPADLVVCTDVLEHVEPECLDEVLAHIRSLTLAAAYFAIALREDSKKTLPDGRNPHLIVRPARWWYKKIAPLFIVNTFSDGPKEAIARCYPR